MNKKIEDAVTEITEAANRIKEISEEPRGVTLRDALSLHRKFEKVLVNRPIGKVYYITAASVETILTDEGYADIRNCIVGYVSTRDWADNDGTSALQCFGIRK